MKRKQHQDSKRDEILRSAIRLFARHGVDGTSVMAIGKEAGVTDAALYKHFPSKDALARAVYQHYSDQFTRIIDAVAAQPGTVRQRLDELAAGLVQSYADDPFGLLLVGDRYDYCHSFPPDHRLPVHALVDLLREGVERGELVPQDCQLTAAFYFGAVLRLVVFADLQMLPWTLEEKLPDIQTAVHRLVGLR